MGFVAFLFFIIIFLVFFLLTVGASILSTLVGGVLRLLGLGGTTSSQGGRRNTYQGTADSSRTSQASSSASNGKIFGADEGEYVDFEEVKDE